MVSIEMKELVAFATVSNRTGAKMAVDCMLHGTLMTCCDLG